MEALENIEELESEPEQYSTPLNGPLNNHCEESEHLANAEEESSHDD